MDKLGVIGAMALMRQYWPSTKQIPKTDEEIDTAVAAWLALLGEYSTEAVYSVIMQFAADGTDFPPKVGQLRKRITGSTRLMIADAGDVMFEKQVTWYREHVKKCHATGIPTAVEAKKQGISTTDWMRMADEAGI